MIRCLVTHAVSFRFEHIILNDGYTGAKRIGDTPCPLLHDVLQLMSKQKLSVRGVRVVLTRSEVDIGTPGKGERSNGGSL